VGMLKKKVLTFFVTFQNLRDVSGTRSPVHYVQMRLRDATGFGNGTTTLQAALVWCSFHFHVNTMQKYN
jgi:hypothetical protein